MQSIDITNINVIGMFLIIIFSLMIITLPRRYAVIPILIGTSYISLGQVIVILGFNFTSIRLLLLVGWLRIILRSEIRSISLNNVDKSVVAFTIVSFITYGILWHSEKALIYKLGVVFNIIGIYFLCRALIRNIDDIISVMRIVVFAIIPIAVFMINEKFTGRNIFHFFGAVREYTMIREGRLRCQGPFTHPILAGTFGVTLMPMFVGLWFKGGKNKILSIIGVVSGTLIVVLCASSGPLMAYVFLIIGYMFWFLRKQMKIVRWSILLSIITLHMIMKGPIWEIIGKISNVTGGTGWHRVDLISSAVKYYKEWWIIGTTHTAHWLPYALPIDPNNVDITNQYLWVGVDGGIISMILFISIIVKGFRSVGITTQYYDNNNEWRGKYVWSLGVALLTYVVSFISVAMFDFIFVYYYMLISFIAVTTIPVVQNIDASPELT